MAILSQLIIWINIFFYFNISAFFKNLIFNFFKFIIFLIQIIFDFYYIIKVLKLIFEIINLLLQYFLIDFVTKIYPSIRCAMCFYGVGLSFIVLTIMTMMTAFPHVAIL